MIYLLIDTCTLLTIIKRDGYNNFISDLLNYINRDNIKLFTHELIIEEWNRNKEKDLNTKKRHLLYHSNLVQQSPNISTINLPTAPFNIENLVNTNHLETQSYQIDNLLNNYAEILTTPNVIKEEFSDRYRNKLAPLHKQRKSQNDWEIIGSFCLHCVNNNLKEVYFISENIKDFADEINPIRTIHPTLKERFPNLKINYYQYYFDFYKELNSLIKSSYYLNQYNLEINKRFTYEAVSKKNDLETLYYIFKDLYSEINFIPTHILNKFSPFSTGENSYAYYSTFTYRNVKEELMTFFENIDIDESNEIKFKNAIIFKSIKDYEVKTKYVLNHLTKNLIFNFSSDKTQKIVRTHYSQPLVCDCAKCSFDRFDFPIAFKSLKSASTNIDAIGLKEGLKLAYIHYQLGNFKSALDIYLSLEQNAIANNKFISQFIIKYNLKQLVKFIGNPFYGTNLDEAIIGEIKKIDLLHEALKLGIDTDYDLISYIAKNDFFTESFQKISKTVKEIVDHYEIQLNGGWSSNQYLWELIAEFATIDAFLNSNYLIYDGYTNFEKLFELVIEGLLASHAMGEDQQGSKLDGFDDYLVHKFIFYGKSKYIFKIFKRYKLQHLKYLSSSQEGESFFDLAKNILTKDLEIKEAIKNYADEGNNYFKDKSNSIFENLVTMAAILDLEIDVVNEFGDLLLDFLKDQKLIPYLQLESIGVFIERKGKVFSDKLLNNYLKYFLDKGRNDFNFTLFNIINCFDKNRKIKINNNDINRLITSSSNSFSTDILGYLFPKLNSSQKEIVTKVVLNQLEKSFDLNLFTTACIYNIISQPEEKIIELLNEIIINENQINYRTRKMGFESFRNYRLDNLINICFKFNININRELLVKLKSIHPYYDWLLDMENFDYLNFKAEWVLYYQTKYYLKIMKKSKKLKNALVAFLKVNVHHGVEKTLLDIIYS